MVQIDGIGGYWRWLNDCGGISFIFRLEISELNPQLEQIFNLFSIKILPAINLASHFLNFSSELSPKHSQ